MDTLKLAALDQDDLNVISVYTQDAVMKVGDLSYQPKDKQFMVAMNRFVWEKAGDDTTKKSNFERRRSALHFDRVLGVKAHNIRQDAKDAVLELLAVQFEGNGSDDPAGHILLHFAGGGAIRLNVECVEAQLCDLGAAWETGSRPEHPEE
ncbi:DUF2948 family protein [Coralliovum pocilloporae]|uniref:DUF2948 family protein n=1 Tax=Coralliovum pocilloporae TaxID=3066369 RepID=UPI003306AA89